MPHSDPTREFYEACNQTELYQLCMRSGLVVSPATPRGKLVSYLFGTEIPPNDEHPVHAWRNGLIGLVQDYWVGIEAQLRCPAKELGPRAGDGEPPKPDPSNPDAPLACYRCSDTRVVACLVENEAHEGLIQLHRKVTVTPKKEIDMSMTLSALTLDNAPRTLAGMEEGDGVGRGALKRLYDQLIEVEAAPRDDQSVVAFVDASVADKRKLVVQYLGVYDQMRNRTPQGSVVQASVAQSAPIPTPVVTAAPAASGEATRTPVNRGRKAASAEVPAAPAGDANYGERIAGAIIGVENALVGISAVLNTVTAQVGVVDKQVHELSNLSAERHNILLAQLDAISQTVKILAAVTLWQIEEKMDTSPSDVLKQGGAYVTILERHLKAGKA